jgi:hypothetical protein
MPTNTPADEPWQRRPDEPAKAYAAFAAYRDIGAGRSVGKAYRQTHPPRTRDEPARDRSAAAPGHSHDWARKFDWRARAEAWDEHLDAETRAAQVAARRKLQERHLLVLQTLSNKLVHAAAATDFSRLPPELDVGLTIEVIRNERLVHGEPVTVERHEHTGADRLPEVRHGAPYPDSKRPEK